MIRKWSFVDCTVQYVMSTWDVQLTVRIKPAAIKCWGFWCVRSASTSTATAPFLRTKLTTLKCIAAGAAKEETLSVAVTVKKSSAM